MASQDNDKAMDGLLRRSLARDGAASSSPKGECPDPELLAAYYDKALGATEVTELDLHFSQCARCREQIAALVRTDAEIGADVSLELVPLHASAPAKAVEAYAAVQQSVRTAPSQFPKSTKSSRGTRRPLLDLRWLAPLAAAIVLAVFVYLRIPPHRAGVASNNEIAMNRQPLGTEAQPASAPAPSKPDAAAAGRKSQPNSSSRPSAGANRSDATSPAPPARKEKKETVTVTGASGRVAAGRSAPRPSAESRRAESQRAESQRAETDSAADQQAPAAPPPQMNSPLPTTVVATNSAVDGAVAPPPPPADSVQKSESPQAVGHAFGKSARVSALAISRSAAELSSQIMIRTPDANVAYRIADKGFIEHTEDGGATWQGQLLNPAADFTAGSAPAPSICWLVGRTGVIFLTVDGKNWRKLPSPSTDDFVAIVAKSARSATVTVTEDEKWTTRNAGKTWQPAK